MRVLGTISQLVIEVHVCLEFNLKSFQTSKCFIISYQVWQSIPDAEASLAFLLLHCFGSGLGWEQHSVRVRRLQLC